MNRLFGFGIFPVLIIALANVAAAQLVLYVSPDGNDAWSGRSDAPNPIATDGPLASLHGARDAIRALRAREELLQPVVVSIRGGNYHVAEPIRFTSHDSGTKDQPIVYRAYPHERPVIHGGRTVSGWRQEGDLWVVDIPEVRDGEWSFSGLWVNGERRQPARTPNATHAWGDNPTDADYFRTAGPVIEGQDDQGQSNNSSTRFVYRPSDLQDFASLDDAVFVIFHSWATSLLRVKKLDKEESVVEFTGPARFHFGHWQPDQRYFIEHLYEGLDSPGEWYLNRNTGRLSYWPLAGEEIDNTEVVAPVAQQLLLLDGSPADGEFVEHLSFEDLAFKYTEYPIAAEGHSDEQAAFQVNAAVEATGGRHCRLERCTIESVGNHAVWFRQGCQHNILRQCELYDLGAGGVRIGEGRSPTNDNEAVQYHTIDNNFIHDGGRVFRSAVGVWIGRSSHNRVTHNEICDFRYTGVSVGWSWGYAESSANHNLISDNHIHHIGLGQLNDLGGIYTLGVSPGTIIRGNHIHDIISHPRLYRGWGLYTDEGSSQILLENNLVYNTRTGGFHQHYGRDNRVVNNIFAYSHGPQIIRSREEDHNSFYFQRNIVFYNNGSLLGSTWKNGHWVINNNCYWDTSGAATTCAGRSWDEWKEEGHDTNSIIADPRFESPESGDFRLAPASPVGKIGFVPFDLSRAGLYGEPEWVARPRKIERPSFTPPQQQ